MTDHTEKKCPECGQQLRIPKNIGGIVMVCPSCGYQLHSDFKLGGKRRTAPRGILTTVFEMPNNILSRIGRYFFPK